MATQGSEKRRTGGKWIWPDKEFLQEHKAFSLKQMDSPVFIGYFFDQPDFEFTMSTDWVGEDGDYRYRILV